MAGAATRRAPAAYAILLAAALGALHTLAHVHTEAWWLTLACVALLAWRVQAAAPGRAALLGFAFGVAWGVASTWWLFVSMHRYGGLPAWLAASAVVALAAFLALFLALPMAAFARGRLGRPLPDALRFGAWWMLAELVRGSLFTGFPWAASGYAQVDGPLARLAPFVGVYGIGFALAVLAAWSALSLAEAPRRATGWWASLALLAVLMALPASEFTRPTRTLAVTLLQGNIAQDEKFESTHQQAALDWHLSALLAARSDLVLAPETAIPLLPQQLPEGLWDSLVQHFALGRTAALVGVPLGDEAQGYTNSAAGFNAAATALPGGFYRYDKHHLVPFGEFIPWGFRWFTQLMNIPLGDFNRGPRASPSFAVGGERIAPNICYEDLFGEELAARFADAASAPTVLANLSNIGWFGETIAVPQHLQISRLRTLELQRPMLRATNTGATAVIDHRGRVTHGLPPHTRGVLEARVQGRDGNTPFASWASRAGLWPLWAVALAILWLASPRRPWAAGAARN